MLGKLQEIHLSKQFAILPNEIAQSIQDLLKEMLLTVGPTFFFVFYHPEKCVKYISVNQARILGYESKNLEDRHLKNMFRLVHPEDRGTVIQNQKKIKCNIASMSATELNQIRIYQDCRIRHQSGQYVRMLFSQHILSSDKSSLQWSMCICSDISHIKQDLGLSLAMFTKDGMQVPVKRQSELEEDTLFTLRELEVLKLLAKGYKSKDIEKILSISLHTVRTHRRNMLKKAKVDNSTQLVNFALKEGYLSAGI